MNNREKLIDAMYKLIVENGYDKASTSKICELAGVTKPTLYHYYKSKEQLLFACIDEYWNSFGEGIADYNKAENKEDYHNLLIDFGTYIISVIKDDNNYNRLLVEIKNLSYRMESVKQKLDDIDKETDEYLLAMIKHGKKLSFFTENASSQLLLDYMVTIILGLENMAEFKTKEELENIWNLFVNSVKKEK